MRNNRAIIAAAGSGKTEAVIDQALNDSCRRVLITTYTNENLANIRGRVASRRGLVPTNVTIASWYSFLLSQCVRPYQASRTGRVNMLNSINFYSKATWYATRESLARYVDRHNDLYVDGISDFVCQLDAASGGAVIRRLEHIFSHIVIDEVQDLVGYDLDVLDLLFQSSVSITLVGDPRQHTFSTSANPKHKKYRGVGLTAWIKERAGSCDLEERTHSHRCNQAICDFSDALFPSLPPTVSLNEIITGHDGVFVIKRVEVAEYVASWKPTVLRENRSYDTEGLAALNIGVAKGRTFDRVLIFSNKPMLTYVRTLDLSKLKQIDRLYVAVTRARFSATFVAP